MTTNPFAGSPLDRASQLRTDPAWLEQALAHPDSRFLPVVEGNTLLFQSPSPRPGLMNASQVASLGATGALPIFLGLWEGAATFALAMDRSLQQTLEPHGQLADLRTVADLLEPGAAAVMAYARAISLWHQRHRHCSHCGAPVVARSAGHVLACSDPDCGTQQFPRLDPAIIVLVSDGQRCLLGRQPTWPPGRYSTIAGFVEPGESLEDAVVREVYEETGIRAHSPRYHSSQPWPLPSSLMLGFTALADGGDITLIDGELEHARWFTREELTDGSVLLPPRLSISRRLIQDWLDAPPGAA